MADQPAPPRSAPDGRPLPSGASASQSVTPGLYRLLVESVRDYAIFALDPTGNVLTWNTGAELIKGYRPDEIIGKNFSNFYTPEEQAVGKPRRVLEIAARTGQYEEEDWRVRKDGSRFWASVLITALHDASGALVGFAKVTRDLTDRRLAQERELAAVRRLAEEEAERHALEAREAELRALNRELEERAREERALRTLSQTITGAVRVPEVMRQIAEGAIAVSEADGAYVEQIVAPNKDVEVVAVAGSATPPCGQRVAYPGSLTEEIISRREPVFLGRMEGFGAAMAPYLAANCEGCSVLVVPLIGEQSVLGALVLVRARDEQPFAHGIVNRVRTLGDLASITLQRLAALAESERRRAEAEAAVRGRDEVLSIVSHDLRNPLSTVTMSAALLRDPEIPLSEEQRQEQLAVIARSAQRMNRLIQDLLDVARIEGGRFTLCCRCEDAGALASEACEAFRPIAAAKPLTFTCTIEPGSGRILADRDRILQVLSNFLNNAVKFTPKHGRITLQVSGDDRAVRFRVSDTGPGIEPEDAPHVFSRFWQAKRTAHLGSGLGLAIAKGIAEAHHGTVAVESVPGQGSTFSLVVPRSAECANGDALT
ncbi:MAG TPA: ATP-binding protein [Gemmatimonadaceae bacterium]|nr:ATP-binding protein [Gemmatimonadaceae bacterium]